jgi:uncharacterized protein YndB with AHSA1/START domain
MTYVDRHTVLVAAPPDLVWSGIVSLGGDPRFYAPRPLWLARGLADGLLGGPGWRIEGPGRPLEARDTMDFWEVVDVRPPTRLRLRAVTRLPGTAYLDVFVHAHGARSELGLETTFEPDGAAGHAYWWSTVAAHKVTFALMTRRLASMVTQPAA